MLNRKYQLNEERTKALFDLMRKAAEIPPAEIDCPPQIETPREPRRERRRIEKQKPVPTSNYYQELEHPQWQRKRLEIMHRANFLCEDCRGDDKKLTVHHCYYEYGMKPWEHSNNTLITLCWECHKPRQIADRKAKRLFGQILGQIKTKKEANKLVKHLASLVSAGRWK